MEEEYNIEECCHNMLCEHCGLELDCRPEDMPEAVKNGVIDEPCECPCHTLI